MSRFGIVLSASSSVMASISWTDNDGLSFVTDRTLTYSTTSDPYQFITQLGTFRKRLMRVRFSSGGPIVRVYGFECDINKGQQ